MALTENANMHDLPHKIECKAEKPKSVIGYGYNLKPEPKTSEL